MGLLNPQLNEKRPWYTASVEFRLLLSLTISVAVAYWLADAPVFRAAVITALLTFIVGAILTMHSSLAGVIKELIHSVSEHSTKVAPLSEIYRLSKPTADDAITLVGELAKIPNARHPFFEQVASEELAKCKSLVLHIAAGRYDCAADDELTRTKSLLGSTQKEFLAISFEDEPWWNSAHGMAYLKLHEDIKAQRPQLSMTRVFLIEKSSLTSLDRILDKHRQIGIETYVIGPTEVPDKCRRDIVICDRTLCRTAYRYGGAEIAKQAEFSDDPSDVHAAIETFESVLRLAKANHGLSSQ